MLKESQLFSLLDKVLTQTSYIRKGEEAVYQCPFCSHHKKKLEINVRTQEWHCWICHSRGRTISSLFYKLKSRPQYFDELYKIVGKDWKRNENKITESQLCSLPEEFIPLWKPSKTTDYGLAMSYLNKRNVSMDEIIRYNIGFCEHGQYEKRILIPSYDKDGNVNFFAARSYVESFYKYMLPPWSKDIIGFELFVNWRESTGITLCEGTFDALTIKNNVIPLFGTTMSNKLKEMIILSGIPRVNIMLDGDKSGINGAITIYEFLQPFDINIHLILSNKKDASELGFKETNKIITNSKQTTFEDIIKIKLNYT